MELDVVALWPVPAARHSDLPDVVAAGDTVEEAEGLVREAIALYLAELRAAGEPIPEPTSVARTVEVVA